MSNAEKRIYIDSETCGLHSMMVLLQYAVEDGPITLYDVWKNPVGETLDLLEWVATHTVVGFNLAFDWFHVAKVYTIWRLLPRDWIPEEHIEEIALIEPKGQDGPCIKPANCLDLLLHSRKGPYQSLMARSDVRIRKVPTVLAYALANELEKRVEIDGIYFARSADKDAPHWQVFDIKSPKTGEIDTNFKDVVLRFNPAGGLKYLAEHALGYEPKYHFKDVEIDKSLNPKELGFAPTAMAISRPDRGWAVYKTKDHKRTLHGYAWPALIQHHIDHWATNEPARDYATDDIKYTRELCYHFAKVAGVDVLPAGDNDSVLACMVPVIRWHGFKINLPGMKTLLRSARAVVRNAPCNINKPGEVRAYIYECMDEIEMETLEGSTKKAKLQAIATGDKWKLKCDETCTKCEGKGKHAAGHCHRCNDTGTLSIGMHETTSEHMDHPASVRAAHILSIKVAGKEVELYRKLIKARKFHASFNIIGTLSTRMSGGDGLNAQGIKAEKEVRSMFELAWEHFILCGGDFDSFEVTLTDAVYNDPDLRKALVTRVDCHKCGATGRVTKCKPAKLCKGCKKGFACAGKEEVECEECDGTGRATQKIHALFAMCLFPGVSYEEIVASAGTKNDMYTKGKQAVFAMIYGGNVDTIHRNLGIDKEIAAAAFVTWNKWFPGSAKAREKTFKAFCSMTQPSGLGKEVVWADPADYVESFLGFRRYFTLENKISKALFDLAHKVPKEWRKAKIKVVRRDRVQFADGAVASALYGASFQIQAANQRAAANHEIQSPGGQITKDVQRHIWDHQPIGVHELMVAPMNVHDELMTVTHPTYVDRVGETVRERVQFYRGKVPLIGMTWNKAQANWAEKKGGSVTLKIRAPEMMPDYVKPDQNSVAV